ncbi:MAG: phenylalanine--tRNA ligase beta subunit-related protein, partial [Planctomycetota bacterium]
MKVSIEWLRDYVDFDLSAEELAARLTMAGIEVEGVEFHGSDSVLELETLSNRPDHLGHIGVAREVAWMCGKPLRLPAAKLNTISDVGGRSLSELVSLHVEDEERCPRYTARLIVDVKVQESPEWLKKRLQAMGLKPINNVVDLSNYVLFEYGQPLHAFDYDRLEGGTLLVRRAAQGEEFYAIADERKYSLDREDLVIADASRPVALAGIMGGI